jgi:hypothetical protein
MGIAEKYLKFQKMYGRTHEGNKASKQYIDFRHNFKSRRKREYG